MNTFFLAFLAFLACTIWNCRQERRKSCQHELPAGRLVSRCEPYDALSVAKAWQDAADIRMAAIQDSLDARAAYESKRFAIDQAKARRRTDEMIMQLDAEHARYARKS